MARVSFQPARGRDLTRPACGGLGQASRRSFGVSVSFRGTGDSCRTQLLVHFDLGVQIPPQQGNEVFSSLSYGQYPLLRCPCSTCASCHGRLLNFLPIHSSFPSLQLSRPDLYDCRMTGKS